MHSEGRCSTCTWEETISSLKVAVTQVLSLHLLWTPVQLLPKHSGITMLEAATLLSASQSAETLALLMPQSTLFLHSQLSCSEHQQISCSWTYITCEIQLDSTTSSVPLPPMLLDQCGSTQYSCTGDVCYDSARVNPTHSATMCTTFRSGWVAVSPSSSLEIRVFTSKKDSCYFFLQFNGFKRASATSLWYSLSSTLSRCGFPLFSPGPIEHLHLLRLTQRVMQSEKEKHKRT